MNKQTLIMPQSAVLLLGRKPVPTEGADVRLEHSVELEDVFDEDEAIAPSRTRIVGQEYRVLIGGRLFAKPARLFLRKDKSGKLALRLMKSKTILFARIRSKKGKPYLDFGQS